MNCDICGRSHSAQHLPFLCAVDARNQLYEKRIAHATALFENEQLEEQINSFLEDTPLPRAESSAATRIRLDTWKAEELKAAERTKGIIAQADRLRADVEAARKDVEERKAAIARRRSDFASASNGIAGRRARILEDNERVAGMTKFKWNRSYDGMAATRGFLCMEAARLYGLRRVKKGSNIRYEIGGLEITELHAMNNAAPEAISTCFAHMTHILMLASHYLAIRLPAEITLPHRDYPRPTILSLISSYQHKDIPFPGTTGITQPLSSSKDAQKSLPTPRPLFIDKRPPALAKDDPVAHKMFLEAVTLFAYDIAWACCSQGVPIGEKSSFEDVLNIGRNLYNLLIGNQMHNNPAGRLYATSADSPAQELPEDGMGELGKGTTVMGRYSHGTSHTYLGDDVSRNFKLPNPKSLTDWLRNKLSSEGTGADWEVLEDDAWAADDHMEDGVLGKGNRNEINQRLFGVESMATVRNALDETIVDVGLLPRLKQGVSEKTKGSGTSGWTKLKSR